MFLLIGTFILAVMYGYSTWRILPAFHLGTVAVRWVWAGVTLGMILPPIGLALRIYGLRQFWSDFIAWIAYLDLGFFTLLFGIVLVKDLVALTGWGLDKVVGKITGNDVFSGRRDFLSTLLNLTALGVTTMLYGWGIYRARSVPAVKRVKIPLKMLPDEWVGFRIVQLSDIHVGETIKRGFIDSIAEKVNQLNADLVVITGDLVDGAPDDLIHHVAPLGNLKSEHGTYFVTGNHEYYSGAPRWVEAVRSLGMKTLLNEHVVLKRGNAKLTLAGITDKSGGAFLKSHRSDPQAALAEAPVDSVKILLAHQPKSIFEAARFKPDVQLSGHTHGGQFFPWNLLVRLDQPFVAGLYQHEGVQLYVSRGTGYWGPPVRVGAPPEITEIELVRA